jgi:hypothetical protein
VLSEQCDNGAMSRLIVFLALGVTSFPLPSLAAQPRPLANAAGVETPCPTPQPGYVCHLTPFKVPHCGEGWVNLHQKAPALLGAYVQQLPDNKADEARYRGHHPAMIIYVFKGGWAHQVGYSPSGQIEEAFWWRLQGEMGDWVTKHFKPIPEGHDFCVPK